MPKTTPSSDADGDASLGVLRGREQKLQRPAGGGYRSTEKDHRKLAGQRFPTSTLAHGKYRPGAVSDSEITFMAAKSVTVKVEVEITEGIARSDCFRFLNDRVTAHSQIADSYFASTPRDSARISHGHLAAV